MNSATKSRLQRWLSFPAVLAFLAAACTQGGQQAGPSAASGDVDPNGAITSNIGTEPDTIDPQKESFVNEVGLTQMVFEGLMTFDVKTLRPVPAAAKDQPKISADGLSYTYSVKDGLKYSDGTPLTAANFLYAFQRTCDPTLASDYAFSAFAIAGCEDYNNMDPKKATPAELAAAKAKLGISVSGNDITFKLREPAPYFNSIAAIWIGYPTRESDVTKGGDKWTEPATYIGNGPFKLSEWKHNEKMVFVRNDNYRAPAKLKQWTYVMINEGAVAFAAYRNNELDFHGVAAEDLRTVEGDPALKQELHDVPGSCTFYYGFNTKKPPFDDVNTRMAFAKAFDRQAYINDVQKVGQPFESFIPPGLPGADPDDHAQKYDIAAAKDLLAKSKYAGKPELQNIKFTYASSARAKTRVEWVQAQWKNNLGITVVLDPVDGTSYTQLVKKFDTMPLLFSLGWCADYPDQQDWLTTVFESTSTVSHVGWKSTQFDTLVHQADKELDTTKRDDLYKQAQRILTAEAPVAFNFSSATKFIQKPWVKGVVSSSTDATFGALVLNQIYVAKH